MSSSDVLKLENFYSTLLEKKGYYTPIWVNKIDMDRISVHSVGWNWHEMYLWLLPNEIRPSLASWTDLYFNAKWDRQSPKPELKWSFPQICLRTVASANQQLYIFSQFSMIILMIPRPTPIGIRHEVLALSPEGMRQSAIAGRVCLTRATIHRQPHPPGACCHRNFGARQVHGGSSEDHTLSRPCFVKDDPSGLLHNCSGLDGVHEQFVWNETTVSCPVVTVPIGPQGSPCWLPTTALSAWIGHRGGRTWQWPIGSMSPSVMSPDNW